MRNTRNTRFKKNNLRNLRNLRFNLRPLNLKVLYLWNIYTMKQTSQHIILFIAAVISLYALSLPSCSNPADRTVCDKLALVDTLLLSDPDAALDTLATLPDSIADPSTAAWRDLLTVKAMSKAHYETIDENKAKSAAFYYDGRGDSLETQSRYYYGYMLILHKKHDQALVELYKAFNLAQNQNDIFFSAMSSREIANVYSEFYALDDELYWNDKSVKLFKQAHKPLHAADAELTAINTLMYIDPKAAKERFDSLDSSYNLNDKYYTTHRDQIHFEILYINKEFKKTIEHAHSMLENGQQLSSNKWSKLSEAYIYNGDITSAREALDSAIALQTTRQDSLLNDMTLSIYQYKTGDYRQAYRSNNSWAHGSADISQSLLKHPGTKQLTEYYRLQSDINQKDRDLKRQQLFIILLISIILTALLLFIIYKVYKSKKLQAIKSYEMQEKLNSLTADLNRSIQLEKKLSSATTNEALRILLENELETINKIIISIYDLPEDFKRKNTIFDKKLDSILADFTSKKTLQSIEAIIDGLDNNWMSNFRAAYPELPQNYYTLVLYLYLGYNTKTISLLMRKTDNAVHSSKYNLKKRLNNNDEFTREIRTKLRLVHN